MKQVNLNTPKSKLLRYALTSNAIFSSISGLLMLVAASYIAELLGNIPPIIITITGAGLIIFAAWVFFIARSDSVPKADVWAVIIGDTGWVVGSVILLLLFNDIFTTTGLWIIGLIAAVVLTFADLQFFGLRRLTIN